MSEDQQPNKELELKVLEAYTRDVGRGVARIDYDTMDKINTSTGDVIEIHGKRLTVGKCLPLYPSDENKGMIRMDGLMRNNSGAAIGETVTINKVKAEPATKITVRPLEAIPPIDARYLADALESIPILNGDNVFVPYFGGRLNFQVVECEPKDKALIITINTVFIINDTVLEKKKVELNEREQKILKQILTTAICTTLNSKIFILHAANLDINSSEFEALCKKFQ